MTARDTLHLCRILGWLILAIVFAVLALMAE